MECLKHNVCLHYSKSNPPKEICFDCEYRPCKAFEYVRGLCLNVSKDGMYTFRPMRGGHCEHCDWSITAK